MIKAVIFDMDGVLFDTEGFYFDRRKIFLEQKGILIDHLAPKDFIGGMLTKFGSWFWEVITSSGISKSLRRSTPHLRLVTLLPIKSY